MSAEIQALESLSTMLSQDTTILHEAMAQSDHVMEDAKKRAPPAVDEVLVAPTVVGNQLYELASEESALGDTMFVLGRGMERGRMEGDVFLKVCRCYL
jgi:ESCRT-I complex subunit TSG101